MIETILTCPLGSKCQEVKDDKIHQCAWFITMVGVNPQTGEDINDKGCAMSWMPILLVENSKQQRSTASAVESFRNEHVKATNEMIDLAKIKMIGH